jgi:hypothetical protein
MGSSCTGGATSAKEGVVCAGAVAITSGVVLGNKGETLRRFRGLSETGLLF